MQRRYRGEARASVVANEQGCATPATTEKEIYMTQPEDDAARLARELAEAAHPFTECILRKGSSDEDRARAQLASDAMTRAYRASDIIATLPIIRAHLAERDEQTPTPTEPSQ